MALEIFCISGVPRLRERTQRARKTAKRSASALAPMTTNNSEDCVCVMLRGMWKCLRRTPRQSGDRGGRMGAIDDGDPLLDAKKNLRLVVNDRWRRFQGQSAKCRAGRRWPLGR